jgi:hypothetical protein
MSLNFQENLDDIKKFFHIPSRLVIKNIPNNLNDEEIMDVLKKNFGEHIIDKILVFKLLKKYSLKKRNKICFLTVDNFETRQNIIDFLDTFELVDPKGIKQKLTVNDCLLQNKIKGNEDQIENTIENCEHFIKFKEYFEKDKLVDFKNEEKNFCEKLFDDVPNIEKLEKDEKKNINLNNYENNGNSNSNFDINNNNNSISNQPTPIKGKFIIKKPQNINNNNNDNNNFINNKANSFNYPNSNTYEDNNKKNNYYYSNKSNNYYDNNDNHNNDDYYSNGNRYNNKNNNYYKKNNNYYNNNDGYYDNSSYKNGYKKGYRKGYK